MRPGLWLSTVRHLRLRQVAARSARVMRGRWRAFSGARANHPASVVRRQVTLPAARSVGAPPAHDPDWHDPALQRLASFDLHGFAWAGSLDSARFIALAHSWIGANERLQGDGWEPYTISVRAPGWLAAMQRLGIDDPVILRSAYAQLRFLARNLEHDVGGNHLIRNLRALFIGAAAFDGEEARRWRAAALPLLERELARQILRDGGHYERNPGYHAVVLDDLRDIASVLEDKLDRLTRAIAAMERFLEQIARPDGKLPLLKDTTWDGQRQIVPSTEPFALLRESGFAVIRDAGAWTIFDFGKPCPDDLPAHAHADALSFEHIAGDEYAIADSGVYEYQAGRWRDYFRSTRAHNTVEVEGVDQSEMWSSFRVGRRARVRLLRFAEDASGVLLEAEHDGYARLQPAVTHRRTLVRPRGTRTLIVADELLGDGSVSAASYLHFAPGGTPPHLATFGFAEVGDERGWYSERFGEKRENPVTVMRAAGRLPLRFGYVLSGAPATIGERDGIVEVEGEHRHSIQLQAGRGS